MGDRLIKKVSKIARNSLQKDLIRTLDLMCEYVKNEKIQGAIIYSFF